MSAVSARVCSDRSVRRMGVTGVELSAQELRVPHLGDFLSGGRKTRR
ncbi:MAG TPA: hypothetical protein VES01_04580 [Dermatophilaceae bacterium]|nr:hypothetical protein [Dermatophilaceae bacterium]